MELRYTIWLGLAALAACTDPTAVGKPPYFIELVTREAEAYALQPAQSLPADSCPAIPPLPSDTVRRRIAGTTATMAFPISARVTSAAFPDGRGDVFNVEGQGFVSVAYGNDLAFYSRAIAPNFRASFFLDGSFNRWCTISIGGRQATVYTTPYDSFVIDSQAQRQMLLPDFVLRVTAPDGRFVNLRATDAGFVTGSFSSQVTALPLLAIAASIRW